MILKKVTKRFNDLTEIEMEFISNMYGDYESLNYLNQEKPLFFDLYINDDILVDASIIL